MIDIKYANAYSEVLEILKYISIEEYNKIPKSKIEVFEANANKDYVVNYNPNKTLEEQNISEGGQAIIGILFRDYWATPKQREKILAKQNYDRQMIEEEKKKRYNPNDIFKKKENTEIIKMKPNSNLNELPVKVEKENLFKRIIMTIKKFFHLTK